jgi:hypothetical protein
VELADFRFPNGQYLVHLAETLMRFSVSLRAQLPQTYEQPLVAPHVSHFSQVPLRTIVKFWHSEHMLPV